MILYLLLACSPGLSGKGEMQVSYDNDITSWNLILDEAAEPMRDSYWTLNVVTEGPRNIETCFRVQPFYRTISLQIDNDLVSTLYGSEEIYLHGELVWSVIGSTHYNLETDTLFFYEDYCTLAIEVH